MWLRLVLGALCVAMAVGQLASWADMPGILGAYQLTDGTGTTSLAAGLITGQLIAGIWFLARPRSTAVAPVWVFTAVAVAWTVLGVQAYARGIPVDNCGCFGRYLGQQLSWLTLAQDALLLVYAVLLLRSGRRARARPVTADAVTTHVRTERGAP